MDKKYFAHYKGIVIQNNDPEHRGRVKVWVPQVNATMYEEWNQLASDKYRTDITSAQHVFLGQNVLSNLTPILLRLKEKLPWAELSQPLIGSGSSGFFQASKTIQSSVDANQAISPQMLGGGIAKISYGAEELTGIHDKCQTNEALQGQLEANLLKSRAGVNQLTEATASKFAGGSSDVSNASPPPSTNEVIQPLKHTDSGKTVTPLGPFGDQITSDACGSSPQHAFHRAPVRDAFNQQGGLHANNNIANPHTHLFRAPNHENKARGSLSIPDVGAVVWVFFDDGNPQYPVINGVMYGAEDYKGVWETHNQTGDDGNISRVQQGYQSELGQGNSPDYPSNFQNRDPSDRQNANDKEDNLYRGKWSIIERGGSIEIISTYEREMVRLAHFGGSFIEFNKLCTSRLATGNDQLLVLKDQFSTVQGNMTIQVSKDCDAIVLGDSYRKIGDVRRWKPYSDNIRQLMRPIHDIKRLFELQRANAIDQDTAPNQTQTGSFADCPVCNQGKQFYQPVTNQPDTLVATDALVCGEGKDWLNTGIAVVPGSFELQPLAGSGGTMYQEPCWCCGGNGLSPSTQDGSWATEPLKGQITSKLISLTNDLSEHERQLGRVEHREGGSVIDVISKNIHQVIGLTFNDFEPYRKDTQGKLVPYGIKIEKGGVYPQYAPSPLVEAVHVDDLPGGDYDLTVCSKYCMRVGGGGIRMQTVGNMTLGGQIITIAGEQLLFSAKSEIAFDAGSRFDVEADIITLRPRVVERDGKKTQQVGIFGSLNIAQNLIVRGGAHIEGELSCQHITAPREWHLTEVEPQITQASIKQGYLIGKAIGIDSGGDVHELDVWSVCAPNSVEVDPHVHWKADPAWTLMETYDDVTTTAERTNEAGVVMPHTVKSCDRFMEQCYPQKTQGRIEAGTHIDPDRPPDDTQQAMDPDPLLDGHGDGTVFANTDNARQRQDAAIKTANDATTQASKYQNDSSPKSFERTEYDQPLI